MFESFGGLRGGKKGHGDGEGPPESHDLHDASESERPKLELVKEIEGLKRDAAEAQRALDDVDTERLKPEEKNIFELTKSALDEILGSLLKFSARHELLTLATSAATLAYSVYTLRTGGPSGANMAEFFAGAAGLFLSWGMIADHLEPEGEHLIPHGREEEQRQQEHDEQRKARGEPSLEERIDHAINEHLGASMENQTASDAESVEQDDSWPGVLGIASNASFKEIARAYNGLMEQFRSNTTTNGVADLNRLRELHKAWEAAKHQRGWQ